MKAAAPIIANQFPFNLPLQPEGDASTVVLSPSGLEVESDLLDVDGAGDGAGGLSPKILIGSKTLSTWYTANWLSE